MKKFHHITQYSLFLLLCLLTSFAIHGQSKDTLPPSRSDIENHQIEGLVITDIKGTQMKIGGFVQADFMYDFRGMRNRNAFQPSSIIVPAVDDAAMNFSIRQTRLNFSMTGKVKYFGDFSALIEFDFSGPDGTSTPRLRHAWISIGRWDFGQYWSNFMDSDIWPNIVDAWGPNAYLWRRQPQLRYTQPVGTQHTLSFSVEQPGSDVTLPADSAWIVRNLIPDFTGAYTFKFDNSRSNLRFGILLHPITYRTTTDNRVTILGGAFNLSGNIRTTGNDALKFQVSYGSGYARYNEDIGGLGYDAMPDPAENYRLRTLPQRYLSIFYDRWWSKHWSSSIGWGNIWINHNDYLQPTAIKQTNYAVANLLWYPNTYFKTGIELLYGNRINLNGERGDNFRIQFTAFIKL